MPTGNKFSIFEKLTPVLMVLLILLIAAVGYLWKKVDTLEKGGTTGTTAVAASPLSVDNLKKYAKELKLNTKDFNKCIDGDTFKQKVADEVSDGSKFGVTGTPSFFVNNVNISGAYPYEVFKAVIEFELKGGDWKKPDATVKAFVDGDEKNMELPIVAKAPEAGDAPYKGDLNATVKIIEYSDFQCPYCEKFFKETLPQIEQNYVANGKVLLVFKQFPLTFHQYAEKAAEAALCANQQGKFWEMHDKLFQESQTTSQ